MRFGVFYEHQLPRPWPPAAEHRLLKDALEQAEIADRVGFDFVWAVEHHFLEEYSHSSASDVFLAACSQRTRRIRLGFGILPLPLGYQHPARVAETVATLDLVSDGRVDLGTGETSSGAELEGFGVDRETKREQWDEALSVVARMMVEEPFAGIDGRFVTMPPRNVVPKPLQKPHPPLWVACSRRETIRLAAEKGLGALSFAFVEPEEAKAWVDEYNAIVASDRCVPAGFAVNPRVAVVLPMMCAREEAEAIERGLDGARYFAYALAHYYVFGEHRPGRTNLYEEYLRRRDEVGLAGHDKGSLLSAIGTPERIADLCRRYEAAGVDQVVFCLQAGRNRHEHICESLELFGAEVLPEFAARADEADAARDAQLADAVDAALARREAPRKADKRTVILPNASGPPPARAGAGAGSAAPAAAPGGQTSPSRLGSLQAAAQDRGERAFRGFVQHSGDRVLERTAGSGPGLRLVFTAMAHQFDPDKAKGFSGEIHYELRRADGSTAPWTVVIANGGAAVRPGASDDPALTLKLTVADFLRIAGQDLDPGVALLTGRLDLEGDFSLAMRLGEMFGQ